MTAIAANSIAQNGLANSPVQGSSFRTVMILALPLLACLGPLVPLAGPLWGFRATCLVLAGYAFVTRTRRRRSELQTRLSVLIWSWALVITGLAVLAPLDSSGRTEVISISTGLSLLWAVGTIAEPKRLMELLPAAWLAAFLVTGVIAVREFITGQHFSNYYLDQVELQRFEASNYVASTFGNPNNYAFFLCSAFPFLVVGSWRTRRPSTRVAYILASMFAFVLVLVTGSRLGAGVIVTEVAVFFLASGLGRKLAMIVAVGALVLVVQAVAPGLVARAVPQVTSQLQTTFGHASGLRDEIQSQGATSGGTRLDLVLNGWDFARDSAFIGEGPGSFEREMTAGDGSRPTGGIVNPHSGWIEILAQYGILILALFSVLLAKIAGIGWGAYRRFGLSHAGGGDFGFAVTGLVLALPVLSMMNSTFLQPSVVWLLLASIYLVATALSEGTAEADG